jgi:hypothetical protein
MPRLYNWIRGEGTTKAQRWGLNGVTDAAPCPGSIGCPGTTPDMFNQPIDVQQQLADIWSSITNPPPVYSTGGNVGGTTLGGWIQNNSMLLLIGGVALLMLKRR